MDFKAFFHSKVPHVTVYQIYGNYDDIHKKNSRQVYLKPLDKIESYLIATVLQVTQHQVNLYNLGTCFLKKQGSQVSDPGPSGPSCLTYLKSFFKNRLNH